METIHITHVETVQVAGAGADVLLPPLTQILTILQDIQARLASLADQHGGPQS